MNYQHIPLDPAHNQTVAVTVEVGGAPLSLELTLRYNAQAGYWTMKVVKTATGAVLLDSIPLVTGEYPAANILAPYAYLGIGAAYVIPASPGDRDYPDDAGLGSEFVLIWGDPA